MNKLKELREREGKNQTEIAKIISVTQSAYSNYENNRDIPTNTLKQLSKFYNVSIDYILDNVKDNQSFLSENLTQDEKELLSFFRATDDDGRSFLLMCAKRVNSQSALTRKKI